jgi:tetratricopeptide (TPR) repeat protein
MIQSEKEFYDAALINLNEAERLLRQLRNEPNQTTTSRPIYMPYTELPLLKIYSNIAFMLEKKNKFEEAAVRYEQALKEQGLDCDKAIIHHNVGLVYLYLGEYTAAKEHQEAANRLIGNSHPWSQEFDSNLKRTQKLLDDIAESAKKKQRKQ